MLRSIVSLKKVSDEGNAYGFEFVHILAFNYDGKGGTIVRHDDEQELDYCHGNDLDRILFGDPGTGHRCYMPVDPED